MSAKKKVKSPELKVIGEQSAEPAPQMPEIAPIEPKIGFDAWWTMKAQSLNLRPELKDAIRKHFQSRGFMENGEFDKGIEDFGI